MDASSHERKIKSTYRSQHHHLSHSRSLDLTIFPTPSTKWLFAPCTSERSQFRYHLALSTLYSPLALFLATRRIPTSPGSLVARLIKCEIPHSSSFAFVNSSSNPPALSRSSSSTFFSFRSSYFIRRTSCCHRRSIPLSPSCTSRQCFPPWPCLFGSYESR